MGRDRRNGQRRSRPAQHEPQPQPHELHARAVDARDLLSVILKAYPREYEAGWPPGGAGLHVMSGPSNATEIAFMAPEQSASRERCRLAAARVNAAIADLRAAALLLTAGEVVQPVARSADSVLERHEFESTLAQREHKRRERELRS